MGTTRWGRDVIPWTQYSGYNVTQRVAVGGGGDPGDAGAGASLLMLVLYVTYPPPAQPDAPAVRARWGRGGGGGGGACMGWGGGHPRGGAVCAPPCALARLAKCSPTHTLPRPHPHAHVQVSLVLGQPYYVTVQGYNEGGERRRAGGRGGGGAMDAPPAVPRERPAAAERPQSAWEALLPDAARRSIERNWQKNDAPSPTTHPPPPHPHPTLPAGVEQGTILSSEEIVADYSPPAQPEGAAVYSTQFSTNQQTQVGGCGWVVVVVVVEEGCWLGLRGFVWPRARARLPSKTAARQTSPPPQSALDTLAASWDPFEDPETGVAYYSYQARAAPPRGGGGGSCLHFPLLRPRNVSGGCPARQSLPVRPPTATTPPTTPHTRAQVFTYESNGGGNPGYVGAALTGKNQVREAGGLRVCVVVSSTHGSAPRGSSPRRGLPPRARTPAPPSPPPPQLGLDRSVYIINLQLDPGASYFVRVYAMNGAGIEGFK